MKKILRYATMVAVSLGLLSAGVPAWGQISTGMSTIKTPAMQGESQNKRMSLKEKREARKGKKSKKDQKSKSSKSNVKARKRVKDAKKGEATSTPSSTEQSPAIK